MIFKQFLKPDWRKIVIFIILLIFFNPLSFTLNCFRVKCAANQSCRSGCYVTIGIFYKTPYLIEWNYLAPYRNLAIISPLIDYFFSCFIVWIYDKVKKKEVKPR